MTDTKALIAEARAVETALRDACLDAPADTIRRLAAALEEATPPEGWEIVEYNNQYQGIVFIEDGEWVAARYPHGELAFERVSEGHDTARAAMEALDK